MLDHTNVTPKYGKGEQKKPVLTSSQSSDQFDRFEHPVEHTLESFPDETYADGSDSHMEQVDRSECDKPDALPKQFPIRGLLPKDETQVAQLLVQKPQYDGRNCIIAILDTGVDPAAPGLAVTSDGKPKVFDLVDCTGSGDVRLSDPLPATLDSSDRKGYSIVGLSGRRLYLNASWVNPKNEWRLGLKHSSELFPKALVDRLHVKRWEKYEVGHAECESKAFSAANQFDKNDVSEAAEDARARKDALQKLWKNATDPGIFFDCIVWHDGTTWRAAIDTQANGDMTSQVGLADYCLEHEFHCFSEDTMLTYSVNIYDDAKTLSIVTVAGSHGTHVAAIAAAYYPENADLNGVAPGAQIVSLKIGDTRLGSMETGSGLVRAATYLATFAEKHKVRVDIANMSYGEAVAVPDFGRFIELVQEKVINESGCVFVSSAGNNGPALTTLGSPGGTSTQIIGVGAYVTEQMVEAEYALSRQPKKRELPFTWSSQPVCANGDVGADIYAPGAAITSVPQYTTQKTQLMNGTSMSSPNAAGCLAVLISALKAENLSYNPYCIRRALINSSKETMDDFKVGFIQVDSCLQYLREHAAEPAIQPFYKHTGVYLREFEETRAIQTVVVNVQPYFMNSNNPAINREKLSLELYLTLETSVPWIELPNFVHLNNGGRSLTLNVDPTNLPSDNVYFAQVHAYDASKRSLGPIFTIPVTVCKPSGPRPAIKFSNLEFDAGVIRRHFISVPSRATFAKVTVSSYNRPVNARFLLHLVQLAPQTRYTRHEKEVIVQLGSNGLAEDDVEGNEVRKWVSVVGGVTLEVCLAQFWSSADPSQVSIGFEFHGLSLDPAPTLIRSGWDGVSKHVLTNNQRKETLELSVTLDKLERSYRPKDATISPLLSRDRLPDGRQINELNLTYEFKVPDGVTNSIKLYLKKLNEVLYDSVFDSVLLAVYDVHKRLLSFQDVYSKPVKLNAGEGPYSVQLQVTSRQPSKLLEPLMSQVLVVEHTLTKAVSLPVALSLSDLLSDSGTTKRKLTLQKGERSAVFIGAAETPKCAKVGDLLSGVLRFYPSESGSYTLDSAAKTFVYYPVASPEAKSGPSPSFPEREPTNEEALRDFKISLLKKQKKVSDKLALVQDVLSSHPTHAAAFQAKVQTILDAVVSGDEDCSLSWADVVQASEELINIVDVNKLEKYFAVKHPNAATNAAEKELKENMEKAKEQLVFALSAKLRGLIQLALLTDSDSAKKNCVEFYQASVQPWASDSTDAKMVELMVLYHSMNRHYGFALKLTIAYLDEPKNVSTVESHSPDYKRIYDLQQRLLVDCEYYFWAKYFSDHKLVQFPQAKLQF